MKKVVYIISFVNKALNFEWLVEELDRKNLDYSFILLNAKPSHLRRFLETHQVPVSELNYSGKKDMPRVLFQVTKMLRKLKPDAIHTNLSDANLIGLLAGKLAGIKCRIYSHHQGSGNYFYNSRGIYYDKIINSLATHVVATNKNVYDILTQKEKVPNNKISTIYYGFKLEHYTDVPKEEVLALKDKYIPSGKGPIIGVISRYMHWKGVQYIIPAFKRLLERYPDAYLILANARGNYKDEIHQLLEGLPAGSYREIDFENNIFALYYLFDIFVHVPIDSQIEAFGQIYVEALATKRPSIFTLSGIANELIVDGKNALVVDYHDSNQIYDKLIQYLEDDEFKKSITEQGYKDVINRFKSSKMALEFQQLYEKIAS